VNHFYHLLNLNFEHLLINLFDKLFVRKTGEKEGERTWTTGHTGIIDWEGNTTKIRFLKCQKI